jgi:Trehalose-6-phosphatase
MKKPCPVGRLVNERYGQLLIDTYSSQQDLHNHVITQTAQAFVTSFLTRCVRSHSEHSQGDQTDVPPLEVSRILPRYKLSQRRLILVDFESTLWQRDISRAGLLHNSFNPPKESLEVLTKLADDRRNAVWLLSGLPVKHMLDKVAALVPHIGIVLVISLPGLRGAT